MNKVIAVSAMIAALSGLAGCAGNTDRSQSASNDAFSQFEIDRARREVALASGQPVGAVPVQPAQVTPSGGISSSELAAAGIGQRAPSTGLATTPVNTGLDPNRRGGLDASPTNAAPVITNNPGISDEQNFDAVASRETIESDAQRRAAQAAAREQVLPTALPDRPESVGPNIVAYALSVTNVKGQAIYSRSPLSGQSRFRRNCADYATADEAQRDFLVRGGPERDRRGLDPDGDGFACGWDPAAFR